MRGSVGRRSVEADAGDLREALPEALHQGVAALVQRARTRARSRARRVGPSASEARNSTAAAAPTIPSWFCVPVSSRSGTVSGRGTELGHVERPGAGRACRTARRRAARRTCTPSRRGSRSPSPGRRPGGAGRSGRHRRRPGRRRRGPARAALGDVVDRPQGVGRRPDRQQPGPRADLPLAGRPSRVARSRGASARSRTVTPRSRSSARQGSTLAWWSSSVTTISSPGPQRRAQRPGQVEGQRRHVGPEGDLVGRGVEEVGEGLPGVGDGVVGLLAGREGPVGVGVVVEEVVGHRLDHLAGHLRPAGAVEVGDRVAAVRRRPGPGNGCGCRLSTRACWCLVRCRRGSSPRSVPPSSRRGRWRCPRVHVPARGCPVITETDARWRRREGHRSVLPIRRLKMAAGYDSEFAITISRVSPPASPAGLRAQPSPQDIEDVPRLLLGQFAPLRDRVPLLQAAPATRRRGVLGDEDRVVPHRRLLAVVGRVTRGRAASR